MDKDVINRKLESLRRCIARITSKMPITREVLRSNDDLQDIIALNLERAVQICVDIAAHVMSETEMPPPSTMAEGFACLVLRFRIDAQVYAASFRQFGWASANTL